MCRRLLIKIWSISQLFKRLTLEQQSISTIGRADAGLCRKSLVVKDDDLVLSLISVSRLDRDGYYITFGGNKAVVTKNGKTLVTAS